MDDLHPASGGHHEWIEAVLVEVLTCVVLLLHPEERAMGRVRHGQNAVRSLQVGRWRFPLGGIGITHMQRSLKIPTVPLVVITEAAL